MSIPLDRQYHYLENICGDDIIIYHWYPHGSKKLNNLTMLRDYSDIDIVRLSLSLAIIFHDQEPLSLQNYSPADIAEMQNNKFSKHQWGNLVGFQDSIRNMSPIRAATITTYSVYDKLLLCHSEKNSAELLKYEDTGFIGVYFWSHAIIARDWFRYAEHDAKLQHNIDFKYDFLIYNRAWSGTREYRLKFCEMLIQSDLVRSCKTSFARVDGELDYTQHVFCNDTFKLNDFNLQDYFIENTTTSCYSADYDSNDYRDCGIEVVLETLFDDQRNHLTEKTLRSIACNKPFILAATPYSLEYLRSYGFKTFNGLIDETYDTIIDPYQRLDAIISELKRISNLPPDKKQYMWKQLHDIANYNQTLFFSKHWHDTIINEFKTNLNTAIVVANSYKTGKYTRSLLEKSDVRQAPHGYDAKEKMIQWLDHHGQRSMTASHSSPGSFSE